MNDFWQSTIFLSGFYAIIIKEPFNSKFVRYFFKDSENIPENDFSLLVFIKIWNECFFEELFSKITKFTI